MGEIMDTKATGSRASPFLFPFLLSALVHLPEHSISDFSHRLDATLTAAMDTH